MSAERVQVEGQDDHLREMIQLVHALELHAPADLAKLLALPELGDDARRAVEAVAALQIVDMPHLATELIPLLGLRHPGGAVSSSEVAFRQMVAQVKHSGAARKVSVSMPEDLTAAVQRRVGRGKFSQYVTEAVTRQLELDLLSELSELLASEHGPVSEEYLAEARAAWPDDE
jgi:Arc/MetJ-type ribon-helix-helix transcriptional regulator